MGLSFISISVYISLGKRLLSVSSIEHLLALSTATLVMQSMFSLSSIDDEGVSVDEMLFTRFSGFLHSLAK